MVARGLVPPPKLKLSFIIDTGADTTMVNDQHMRSLGIPERGARDILTATSDVKPTSCSTYDVQLRIETFGDPPFVVPAIEVFGRPLFNHSIDGMIGRDVLNRVVFSIDGPGQSFRIDY
jgi:predicted aspartyl protease